MCVRTASPESKGRVPPREKSPKVAKNFCRFPQRVPTADCVKKCLRAQVLYILVERNKITTPFYIYFLLLYFKFCVGQCR